MNTQQEVQPVENDTLRDIPDEDIYVVTRQVRAMFGGCTSMTLGRWRKRQKDPFPAPIVINNKNYFGLTKIRAWRERQRQAA